MNAHFSLSVITIVHYVYTTGSRCTSSSGVEAAAIVGLVLVVVVVDVVTVVVVLVLLVVREELH